MWKIMLNSTKILSIRAKGRKNVCAKCTVGYSPGNICYPSTHTTVSGEKEREKRAWFIYNLHSFHFSLVSFSLCCSSYLVSTVSVLLKPFSSVCSFESTLNNCLGFGLRVVQKSQNSARKWEHVQFLNPWVSSWCELAKSGDRMYGIRDNGNESARWEKKWVLDWEWHCWQNQWLWPWKQTSGDSLRKQCLFSCTCWAIQNEEIQNWLKRKEQTFQKWKHILSTLE